MSFYEDLASALDDKKIEQRIVDKVMHVPTSADVDLTIEVDNEVLPAARIYVSPIDDADEDTEPVLLQVVFSIPAAVDAIREFLATADAIAFIDELVDDPLGRIVELEFLTPHSGQPIAFAQCGATSLVVVEVIRENNSQRADLSLVVCSDELLEKLLGLEKELSDAESSDDMYTARYQLFDALVADAEARSGEAYLSLGSYEDLERVFTLLPFISRQAEQWEKELLTTADRDQSHQVPEDLLASLFGVI